MVATKKNTAKPRRISFARAIEASADGVAPSAARLWRAGKNATDKGDLLFTPRSAKLVIEAYEARGNPLVWYYDHEDRIPLEKRGGAPMRGACSASSSMLVVRDSDEGPELWAEAIEWTPEAKRQIETGERRQLSPIAAFDEKTREIVEIINVSLCTEGATHHGTLLASRGNNMEELIQKIMAAIEAGDWETAENLINEAEAAESGGAMAKMARAAMKAAKEGEDGGAGTEEAAEKKLAAALSRLVQPQRRARTENPLLGAFSRELADGQRMLAEATAEAKSAAKESRRATVKVLIASRRDLFDAADEREHLNAADPAATERYIASMERKAKAGILVASRDGATGTATGAKPPKDPPERKPEDDLTAQDKIAIDQFNRGKNPEQHITAAEYLASKQRNGIATAAGRN